MRRITTVYEHRVLAWITIWAGLITFAVGIKTGSDSTQHVGTLALAIASVRVAYLSLVEQDRKYDIGHRRGFQLGRQVAKPVVAPTPIIRKPPAETATSEARCEPSRGRNGARPRHAARG